MISTCVRMKTAAPRCERVFKAACTDSFDAMDCGAAAAFCFSELSAPYSETGSSSHRLAALLRDAQHLAGLNPYDISKKCEGPREALCYPVTTHITNYLSLPSTHAALGVDDAITGTPFH
jgi:hypothetical protein